MNKPLPYRGQIWVANLVPGGQRHWVLVVSLDSRNLDEDMNTVLIVPFGSTGREGVTTLRFEPGETGLPAASLLKCHFITTLAKSQLIEPLPRLMSRTRMREVSVAIRRSFDSDAFSSTEKPN